MIQKLLKTLNFVVWVGISSPASAQDPELDSIWKYISVTADDTLRIEAYFDLFDRYEFSDEGKALEVLEKAKQLITKIGDKRRLADLQVLYGYLAEDKGNYFEALKHYLDALETSRGINDQRGMSIAMNNAGITYYEQGNFPEALKQHYASLRIKENIAKENPQDIYNQKGIAASYTNLGNVYFDQSNFTEALKCQLAALKIREKLNDRNVLASTYHNIANVYAALHNDAEALKQYRRAMEINKENNNKLWLSKNYDAIAIILEKQSENDDETLRNYTQAKKLKEEIGDSAGIALSYSHLGSFYAMRRQFDKAKEQLKKGEQIGLEVGNKDCLKGLYRNLAYVDSATGDFRSAFEDQKLYKLYSDSLDNEQTRKSTVQAQMNYEFDKREAIAQAEHKKELENQEVLSGEKNRKQNMIILFVCSVLLLVAIFAVYIYRSLKQTILHKQIIEEQKLEVENQKNRIEEYARNIVDSITYARRIQRSLLPTEKYIHRQIERLKRK